MRVSKFARKGFRKLSLLGIGAITIISIAVAAVPGFPFTEDFTSTALRDDPQTTADWDTTGTGTLRLGLATELTGMTLTRGPLDSLGEVAQTSRDIALGDLDGDGDLDAVVGNEGVDAGGAGGTPGAPNLVYFNNAGTFGVTPVEIGPDELRTSGVALGDLDRDGDLDIAAGNFQQNGIYYLNDGAGNFAAGVEFTTAARKTWKVALTDVDGDGDLDYIEGASGGRNSLYLNLLMENGAFSFGPEIGISNESFLTRSIAVGDINNDGDIDFIAGDQLTGNRLYSNNGSGVFTARGEIDANLNKTFSVALADLDGDGFIDLVEGNGDLPTQIYFNNSAVIQGSFLPPVTLSDSDVAHTTLALLLRDFDRDGDIDIVEGNNGEWDHDNDVNTPVVPQPIRLFLNNGDGTFAAGTDDNPPVKQKTYGMAAGDIDGDGILDFVAGNSINGGGVLPTQAGNVVYFVDGTATANSVRQLDGVAVSLEVNNGAAVTIPTARLIVDRVQPAILADLDFYLSNDNGQIFVPVEPGRPVVFPDPTGNQLMWKVDMLTSSPNAAQLAQINQVDIAANSAPVFASVGDLNGTEGQPLNPTFLSNYFSDADNDVLTYQVSGLPTGTGLSLDARTGLLSGTLTNADAQAPSPINLSLSASDGAESDTGNIQLTVNTGVNDPPVAVNDGPFVIDEGGTVAAGANVLTNDSDPENDPLTAVPIMAPANAASFVLNADGTFDYTHDGGATVVDSFTYAADDGNSQSAAATVSITINPVDDPPVITLNGSATVSLTVGNAYTDAGAMAMDEEDGDLTGNIVTNNNVNTAAAGTYSVTYDVMDSGGNAAVQVTRTVNVNAAPPPPRKSSGGFFGLWELLGLTFVALLTRRRSQWIARKA